MYYNLPKPERDALNRQMKVNLLADLRSGAHGYIHTYFSDADTYIRKNGYIHIGKIYGEEPALRAPILKRLQALMDEPDFKIRQTAVNAAGEIGKTDFTTVQFFFDTGLTDAHHSVRNAVIGSVKKMGEKNPLPVLAWAQTYLTHPDKEIRREICHGIELRGRSHPQDILPLLRVLEFDPTARVRNTLVHVLGQIAYKKGSLPTVVQDLKTWQNKKLVTAALLEIIDVHDRYKAFAPLTQAQAEHYVQQEMADYLTGLK